MASLRTKETEQAYADFRARGGLDKGCPLCLEDALHTFEYWKIIPNDFPYDRVADPHHMIVPLRHVTEAELTEAELKELRELKPTYLNDNYQFILEATHRQKSIPGHFHLHLIVAKEEL